MIKQIDDNVTSDIPVKREKAPKPAKARTSQNKISSALIILGMILTVIGPILKEDLIPAIVGVILFIAAAIINKISINKSNSDNED